jgi:hypothetical protein
MRRYGMETRADAKTNPSVRQEVNDRVYEISVVRPTVWADFMCECPDDGCNAYVSLTLREFEELRAAGQPVLAHRPSRA